MLSPSQTTWAPPCVPWAWGLQGLREMTGWQAGAMEDEAPALPTSVGCRVHRPSGVPSPQGLQF